MALLNRGTPGGVVTPDGTLHMSLMRSCSGWPSRIWIDGDPRTAPDGSSFAWQHWSHTFEYALASGPGDWRTAGFCASAEDYNHDLITVTSDGLAAPDGADLLSVEPANVTLSTVKPRGNPLASERSPAGRAPEATALGAGESGEAEVTVRLRETSGQPTAARVRLAQPVSAAWLTDLLEEADGATLPVVDGAVIVGHLGPADRLAGRRRRRPGRRRTGPAGLRALLVAREGPGAGREPPGGRPLLPRPGRPGRAG